MWLSLFRIAYFDDAARTQNSLSIPVGGKRHSGLEVALLGETTLKLAFEGEADSWRYALANSCCVFSD
jgi:hypothetical protein